MENKMKYTTISEYLDTNDPNVILEQNKMTAAKENKKREVYMNLCKKLRETFPNKSSAWVERQASTIVNYKAKK